MDYANWAALLGLASGAVLGLAARLGEFCTFGAIESAYMGHDQRRARIWGIVLGVAILCVFTLDALGQIDVTKTIYHSIQWNPIASIIGGLLFGYGMSLAGNCGFGALARFGGGDLRSMVVVVVIGIVGFATISGPLAHLRVILFVSEVSETPQGFAHSLASITGMPPILFAIAVATFLILWSLLYPPLRERKDMLFWSVAAGLAIASAFWGTSILHETSFDAIAVQGHTFTGPIGRTLLFLLTSSGGGIGFSVGSVSGVIFGAFIGSMIKGHFRWEACDDPQELGRQILGACLMAIGGVVAVGCSIGQGVSAFATLAYSAPVTLAAIIAGAIIGIKHLISGFEP
jgi:uncharacterized membrane protein YedE/YeeE